MWVLSKNLLASMGINSGKKTRIAKIVRLTPLSELRLRFIKTQQPAAPHTQARMLSRRGDRYGHFTALRSAHKRRKPTGAPTRGSSDVPVGAGNGVI